MGEACLLNWVLPLHGLSRENSHMFVVVGEIRHESIFYFHPVVERVPSVQDWLGRLR